MPKSKSPEITKSKLKTKKVQSLKSSSNKKTTQRPTKVPYRKRFRRMMVLWIKEFKRVRWPKGKILRNSFFKIIFFTIIFGLFVYALTTVSILVIGSI